MRSFFFLLSFICIYSFSFSGYGQLHTDSLREVHLDTVRVNDIRPTNPNTSIQPMQILDRNKLEAMNATDVSKVVQYLPGVTVKDYGGIGGLKSIAVRSLGATHTAVILDGIQMQNAQSGQVDLGRISLQNISEIILYEAQAGELLQPARNYTAASVLYVTTMNVHTLQNHSLNLYTGLQVGSFGWLNPSFSLAGQLGSKISAGINFDKREAHGQYPYLFTNGSNEEWKVRKNTDVHSIKLEADVLVDFSEDHTLHLKTYYFDSERGLPGAVILYNDLPSAQRQYDRDFFIQGKYRTSFHGKLPIGVNFKFLRNQMRYIDPVYHNLNGVDDQYCQSEYYGSFMTGYRLNQWLSLSFSSDIIRNTLEATQYAYASPSRLSSLNVIAAKIVWKNFDIHANVLTTLAKETTEEGQHESLIHKFTPSVALGYQPFEQISLRLRASYKNTYRLPTFNELYYTQVGSIELKPEFVHLWNIGLTYEKANWAVWQYLSFQLDMFRNHTRDKILAVPAKNLFYWSMRNVGEVHATGMEASMELWFRPLGPFRFSLTSNWTLQQALDKSAVDGDTYGHQIAYTPFVTGSGRVNLHYQKWSLHWNMLHTGHRYTLGQNIKENYLPSWTVYDVSLAWQFKYQKTHVTLKGEVNNLFDHQYMVVKNYPMAGRNYRFSIVIDFKT